MTNVLPPHSPDAEFAVLECIAIDAPNCLPKCQALLEPTSFYDIRNRGIYLEFCAMAEAMVPIDSLSLGERLMTRKAIDSVGGWDYLCSLGSKVGSAANIDYWLNVVLERHSLRKLLEATTKLQGAVYSCSDVPALMDEAERAILAVRPKFGTEQMPTIRDLTKRAIAELQEAYETKGEGLIGMSSGFKDIDAITGGLVPGEMTVIAAPPSTGKTTLAMNIAERVMLDQSRHVGVNSLEMTGVELVKRFISSHSKVNLKNVYRGELKESDFQGLFKSSTKIAASSIFIDDASDLSIHQLRPRVRRMWQEHKIELWIVDYIQLLNAQGGSMRVDSREQEVNAIARGIKATAKELNIPVIAVSQLNDDGQLRESRAIGMHADNVWVLEEKEKNPEVSPVSLFISKNRNGPRFETINLTFLKTFTRFELAPKISDEDANWRNPTND